MLDLVTASSVKNVYILGRLTFICNADNYLYKLTITFKNVVINKLLVIFLNNIT
jgi:hypothetical protein